MSEQEKPEETVDIKNVETPESFKDESEKDNDAILDAVKELTKQVSRLADEWTQWRKAGKF